MAEGPRKAPRYRGWQFTVNNWQPEDLDALKALLPRCKRAIWQPEVGQSGTPHLQGYLELKCQATASAVMKLVPRHGHIEPCRNPCALWDYCAKADTRDDAHPEAACVHGVRPMSPSDKGDAERERYKTALEAACRYDYDAVPDDILVRHGNGLIKAALLRRKRPRSRDTLDNVWRWGLAGGGKSSDVRKEYGEENVYIKGPGHWWCEYRDEPVVLIEDVSPEKSCNYTLRDWKTWADHYPFRVEPKHGSMMIRPAKIIVTSQYSIDVFFKGCRKEDIDAIKRRFVEVHVPSPLDPPPVLPLEYTGETVVLDEDLPIDAL